MNQNKRENSCFGSELLILSPRSKMRKEEAETKTNVNGENSCFENGRLVISPRSKTRKEDAETKTNVDGENMISIKNPEHLVEHHENDTGYNKTEKNKKKKKKKNVKAHKGAKSSETIKKMPFHPDKKINKIINNRFDNIKFAKDSYNDTVLTDIFMKLYQDYVCYTIEDRQFYYYTGKYWKADNGYMVYRFMNKTVDKYSRHMKKTGVDSAVIKQVTKYYNHSSINGLLEMAKSRCACSLDEFDKSTHLVNVRNGTINLITKTMQDHSPNDKIRHLIDVDYNPHAKGKRFKSFISEICNENYKLEKYIQVIYGYAFTGETSEQCFFMEKGSGSNGKSTLNDVIATVTGDYSDRVDMALFQRKRYASANSPTPELAKLQGKHIVFCSETDNNQLNEAMLKEVTGGTRITARALYKEPFSYTPKFTIIFDGNNLPTIKGTDYGIWRRIIIIPFDRTFKPNITLKDELLNEKEAILNWLIEGANKYYEYGFPQCPVVEKATKKYRSEENTVEAFVKNVIVEAPGEIYPAGALYTEYEQYCKNCGDSPIGIKAFKNAMHMLGYKDKRCRNGVFWIGIQSNTNEMDEMEV